MSLNPPRILVVDDHRDAADNLTELLVLKGCDAQVAYSGARALSCAATFQPDIIFLDINMPDVDGYLVVGALRELLHSHAYIVALTGQDDDDTRARARASGFDEFLPKPSPYAAIMRVIARHALPVAA